MFRRLNLNSISFGNRKSYRLKEKLASTLAAVALACGCAASLSACGNKNHAAKSIASSASESTTTSSENSLDSEIGDAGLTFKTIHSDLLDMDITIPEQAKVSFSGSDDLLAGGGKSNGEDYLWKMGDIYYQIGVTRTMAESCPPEASSEYGDIDTRHDSDPEPGNFYKLGDDMGATIMFFESDWNVAIGKLNSNGCPVIASVSAGEKLTNFGLEGGPMAVDNNDYDKNGIDDAKRQTIKPIVRAVAKHLMKSVDATS